MTCHRIGSTGVEAERFNLAGVAAQQQFEWCSKSKRECIAYIDIELRPALLPALGDECAPGTPVETQVIAPQCQLHDMRSARAFNIESKAIGTLPSHRQIAGLKFHQRLGLRSAARVEIDLGLESANFHALQGDASTSCVELEQHAARRAPHRTLGSNFSAATRRDDAEIVGLNAKVEIAPTWR